MESGLQSVNVLGHFAEICYIYLRITQRFLYTPPPYKKIWFFLIMYLTNIKNIDDIYYPRYWDNFHNKTNYILVENESTKLILILSLNNFA